MTTKTEHLLIDFFEQGHPLGRAIRSEEAPRLVEALRRRLGCATEELDLSPGSLKRLEQHLIALHHAIENGQVSMSDEDLVSLIREVGAYLGEVMVVNLGGHWDDECIPVWISNVSVPLPLKTIKGKEIRFSPDRGFPAVHIAAFFWEFIRVGKAEGFLWEQYKLMTQKRWRETIKGLEEAIALQKLLER